MADVSHELGALRFVVESPLSSKVAMFNNAVTKHQESQQLNPFSQTGGLPKPTFNKGEYGKPLAGSLTEMRGQKANIHVLKEMLELCQIIDSEGYEVKNEPSMKVIPFGELFNIYTYISDKLVGILLRARKHKLVEFEGEVLFQRRDDNVPVFLLKPIKEIRQILEQKQDEIRRSVSPAPQSTSVIMDQQKRAPSASPTPIKPKATKQIEKGKTDSETDIVKPIAQKATPIPTIEIQNEINDGPLPQEAIIVPVATAVQSSQEVATTTTTSTSTSTSATAAPTKEDKITSATAAPTTEDKITPATEISAITTESSEIVIKTDEVISLGQSAPKTIVTPPTPTVESAASIEILNVLTDSDRSIVDEKMDINNNEEAPAIVATVETSSNTEVEPPADGTVSTASLE